METQIQSAPLSEEKIFYRDHSVSVSQSRFTNSNITYALRNISSVSNYRIKKSRTLPILIFCMGIPMLFSKETLPFAIVFIVVGISWFWLIKDLYAVRINSNSGQSDGIVSKDKQYIQKIVDAMNEAIIFRG